MKIASWNVNSIRQRESHVLRWLEREKPDLLFLQEIKCEEPAFPALRFKELGYRADVVGQKSYNGVAVLGRIPYEVTARSLPGLPEDDTQSRFIEVAAGELTVAGIYLPNGNSGGEAGYQYKLAWMAHLAEYAKSLMNAGRPYAILGDFNVCPTDEDLAPGSLPPTDALVRPETRAAWRRLLWLGMTDAVRALHPRGAVYTFWDYQAGAWQRDRGLRIDHALLCPVMAERLTAAVPDRAERGEAQPSDHVPLTVTFS